MQIACLLGKPLNCETWGCELFPYRAENAAARMDKCHSAAWESCSLTDESVTLLWLNPPYDDDRHGDEKRLELAFLKSTMPKLVLGGVLAFVIPQRILHLAEIARYLASQYERLTVLRFPDGEYERFKQIPLLATRREKHNVPTSEEIEAIQHLAEIDLSPLGFAPEPAYSLLPAPLKGAGTDGKFPDMLRLTDQGRLAYWLLTSQLPQQNEYDLLLERHVPPEHTLLNQQAADMLREAGYQVNLTPPEITLQDGGLFRPDLAIIDDQGVPRFVEVERDMDNNLEQRQTKWRNFYQASRGRMFVMCDNRSCMRNIHSEINYCLGNKSMEVFLTNLVDIQTGKRGEGDRVWLEVKQKG